MSRSRDASRDRDTSKDRDTNKYYKNQYQNRVGNAGNAGILSSIAISLSYSYCHITIAQRCVLRVGIPQTARVDSYYEIVYKIISYYLVNRSVFSTSSMYILGMALGGALR